MFRDDYFLRMAFSGVLATLISTIVDEIAYYANLIEGSDIITFVASVLLPDTEPLDKISAKVTSLIGHLTMGAGFGIICGLVLWVSSSRYPYIKGMGVGAFYWLFMHQAITGKYWVRSSVNNTSRDSVYEFLKHMFLGWLTILISFWL